MAISASLLMATASSDPWSDTASTKVNPVNTFMWTASACMGLVAVLFIHSSAVTWPQLPVKIFIAFQLAKADYRFLNNSPKVKAATKYCKFTCTFANHAFASHRRHVKTTTSKLL